MYLGESFHQSGYVSYIHLLEKIVLAFQLFLFRKESIKNFEDKNEK